MLKEIDKVSQLDNMSMSNGEDCVIIRVDGQSGEGFMTAYALCEGIQIIYNDFHMKHCDSSFHPQTPNFMCLDHCREGRLEQHNDGLYYYFEAGDFRIDNRKKHDGSFDMPLAHYHGITIAIDIDEAEQSLAPELKTFNIDLRKIYKKFCEEQSGVPCIVRQNQTIEHIFSELYNLPTEIKQSYQKIKVLELLLFLTVLDFSGEKKEHLYFYRTNVEKVKAIYKLMTDNPDKHYTLEWLAKEYDISLTQMKNCFKEIYGAPIFSFMREYRMNRAAMLLKSTRDSVADIGIQVGYDNPSKFISAFKEIMGKTPLEYRKSIV